MFPVVESVDSCAHFSLRQLAVDVALKDRFGFVGGFKAFHAHAGQSVIHLSDLFRAFFL